MAQKISVLMVDDLDGTESDGIETITFGLDGVTYEIDLNEEHAESLREGLADFVESARRTGGRLRRGAPHSPHPVNGSGSVTGGSGRTREQLTAIRQWARNNGHDVSDRGRISAEVLAAFDLAHQTPAAVKGKPQRGARRALTTATFTG